MSEREISDDDLRARLSRIDPAPAGTPVDPVTSPRARELVERIMETLETPSSDDVSSDDVSSDELAARRRRRPLLLAAAGGVAALVGGAFVLGGGFGEQQSLPIAEDPTTTLTLEAPGDTLSASCMIFSVDVLREMPVALGGTVTSVEPGSVTLDVDRWYRGGDADLVTISVPDTNNVALDGVDLRSGERYLLTATNGTVNGCGYSGPAGPQLEGAFAEAFGG
jgi:hypothetical protein